jgi:hypothetical protein
LYGFDVPQPQPLFIDGEIVLVSDVKIVAAHLGYSTL